jgi:hypothetical protein
MPFPESPTCVLKNIDSIPIWPGSIGILPILFCIKISPKKSGRFIIGNKRQVEEKENHGKKNPREDGVVYIRD